MFGSIFGRRKRRQEEEQKAKELEEEIAKSEENYEKEIERVRTTICYPSNDNSNCYSHYPF